MLRQIKEEMYRTNLNLKPFEVKIATQIAKKWCRNGKCLNKIPYECCICNKEEKKACKDLPDHCLMFFCDPVVRLMTKREKILMSRFLKQLSESHNRAKQIEELAKRIY